MQSNACVCAARRRAPWFPVFLLLAALITVPALGAQETGARIYYAQGSDFTLTVNGVRRIIGSSDMTSAGILINPTDLVQTGPGVSLELQLLPSGTVVKVIENTSLVYNGYDSNGGFADLGLLYGRVRVVTGMGWGSKTVVLRAGNTSVRLGEGDIGADFAVDPASEGGQAAAVPLLRVYNFKGSVVAHPFVPGNDTVKPIPVAKAEYLTIEINPPLIYTGQRPLERDIVSFWNTHNFAGSSPIRMPDTALDDFPPAVVQAVQAVPEIQEAPPESPPALPNQVEALPRTEVLDLTGWQVEMNYYKTEYRYKTAFLVAGLVFTAVGIGAQAYAYNGRNRAASPLASVIYQSGYASIGLGLLSILAGTLYDPLTPLE